MSRSRGGEAAVASTSADQEHLRNICILAHVDHGKTTCADNLISSNGIISRQSAGKIRYMDSRLDEQERQITMKSSAIALRWRDPQGDADRPTYVVNLIDSPGHVDFTSEVSTAARLADGALIVVDVVEGVEAQTRTVLRQAWRDRVKTCLLLNKVDRMVVELELTPLEAYQRMVRIVEQVNAVNQQLLSEAVMAKDAEEPADAEGRSAGSTEGLDLAAALEFDQAAEEALCYSPERGNVAFGSAAHGWAFRLDTFASMIAGKMGAKPQNLQRVLWGDWAFNKKTRRAQHRNPSDAKSKPMFVELVLQPLYSVYEASYKTMNVELLRKMQLQIPAWQNLDLEKLAAGPATVRELLSRWLPFADCVLQMAAEHLPSPTLATADRLPVLCPRWFADRGAAVDESMAESLRSSNPGGPVVAYLAKFLAADLERLVLTGDALAGDESVHFVGLCRVFSGTLRPGQELFVAREEGLANQQRGRRILRAERLFVLMGRFLEEVPAAAAGSVVAALVAQVVDGGGAGAQEPSRDANELGVERCLTLCEREDGPCFETPYSSQAFAIVRVSIEPQNVADLDALDRGLRLLHRADPSVSVEAMVTGENVLGCCGDEHLKRCITDLQKQYAHGVPLSISKPLVAVRESIARSVAAERMELKGSALWLPSWATHLVDASTEASSQLSVPASEHDDGSDAGVPAHPQERVSMSSAGIMAVWTANRKVCLRVSAMALPIEVLLWMDEYAEELESVVHRQRASLAFASGTEATLDRSLSEVVQQFGEKLRKVEGGCDIPGVLCGMSVSKGGRAVLLDATGSAWTLRESYQHYSAAQDTGGEAETPGGAERVPAWMRPSVLAGFQLAANAGPLCEEPMRGIALVLHGCQVISAEEGAGGAPTQPALAATAEPYGPMSGQVMVAMKEACRYCLFRRGFARICEAMLTLEVQCEQEMLGKVYAVLGKRRVKVLDEGLRDGTSLFYISSYLPLADSFGLAHDLRAAASGQVSFHCAFSHWEQSEDDPFQEASLTPEELEDLGDQPVLPNTARKLIDAIRKRKGLPTDEKVVNFATKQRTVTRMK